MKWNFTFSKLIENKKFLIALSILIAVIAWFTVATTFDPYQERVISDVPITLNLAGTTAEAQQLSVIDGQDTTIDVKIQGKRYLIADVTADDLVVTPNLATVTAPGQYEVSLSVQTKDPNETDFSIRGYTQTVTLRFDHVKSVNFDLKAKAEFVTAQEGYIKETPTATPQSVVITGAQSEVEQIAECVVEYDKSAVLSSTLTAEGKLVLYDASGKKLDLKYVSFSETTFQITVPIYLEKEFPIELSFINTNGIDTSKFNYTLSVDTVHLAGPEEIISKREKVTIGPLDLTKLDIGSVFMFPLDLDAGEIDIDNVGEVTVEIDSTNFAKSTMQISEDNIVLKNAPADLNVTLHSTSINNVKMVGSKSDIESLTASELFASVDLSNVEEGTSRVRVSIYATGNKFVWAVGEYYVTVKSEKKA